MSFPDRLKSIRVERGLKLRDVSDTLSIALRSYQRYEHGEREPDIATLIVLADYFGVSLDYLVGRSDVPTRK